MYSAAFFQLEVVFDVGTGFSVGGGGEGDAGDGGIAVGQKAELAVFGAEVMPPLADAVGFVDGKQADGGVVEKTQKAFGNQAFGRNIKQFQTALGDVLGNLPRLFGRSAAVHRRAVHARRAQVGTGRSSARSAAKRRLPYHQASARESGNTAICRRRWASAPSGSAPPRAFRRFPLGCRETPGSRTPRSVSQSHAAWT